MKKQILILLLILFTCKLQAQTQQDLLDEGSDWVFKYDVEANDFDGSDATATTKIAAAGTKISLKYYHCCPTK
jgi:hypothetical protein